MIKTKVNISSALMAICISMMIACGNGRGEKKDKNDRLPVNLTAIHNDWGWGYEIRVDGKLFVKQDYIPVIPGKKGFASKEQALFVGNRAIDKMKKGIIPPTISRTDLIDAGVEEAKDSVYIRK